MLPPPSTARAAADTTDLFRPEVRRGVDEERLVSDVLLDLLPCSLSVLEPFLRQRDFPVWDMDVRLPIKANKKRLPSVKD